MVGHPPLTLQLTVKRAGQVLISLQNPLVHRKGTSYSETRLASSGRQHLGVKRCHHFVVQQHIKAGSMQIARCPAELLSD